MGAKTISIVTDGSYVAANKQIGVGIVTLSSTFSDSDVISKTLRPSSAVLNYLCTRDKLREITVAEGSAIRYALSVIPAYSNVTIYSDYYKIINHMNGMRLSGKDMHLHPVMALLKEATLHHKSVTFRNHDDIPSDFALEGNTYSALAHNASALASGSTKITDTPGYEGLYSPETILFKGYPGDVYTQLVVHGYLPKADGLHERRITKFRSKQKRISPF